MPNDITVNVDVDVCGSNPIFSTPKAIDNCDVTVSQTGGPLSGTTFPAGVSTIQFTATDECGNTDVCTFDITVEDTDIPFIACPGIPLNVCADEGTCTWTAVDIGPTLGIENCPGYKITYEADGATSLSGSDDASGEAFNLGVTKLCYIIEDDAGNSSMCCLHVTV